jgi:hypothetical protein
LARFYSVLKKTRQIAENLEKTDTLVIGNLSYDIFADAISRSSAGRNIVLDDGLKTVLLWSAFEGITEDKTLASQKLKEYIFGLARPDSPSLEYFSLFEGQKPDWAFAKKNEFQSLQEILTPSGQEQIIILGQPSMEQNIASNRKIALSFKKQVEKVLGQFPRAELKYYAHRNSDLKKVYDIVGAAADIVCPDMPVELYLLNKKVRPVALIGFYSTALFSIAQIFGGLSPSVTVFLPDELDAHAAGLDLWRTAAYKFFNNHPSPFHLIE